MRMNINFEFLRLHFEDFKSKMSYSNSELKYMYNQLRAKRFTDAGDINKSRFARRQLLGYIKVNGLIKRQETYATNHQREIWTNKQNKEMIKRLTDEIKSSSWVITINDRMQSDVEDKQRDLNSNRLIDLIVDKCYIAESSPKVRNLYCGTKVKFKILNITLSYNSSIGYTNNYTLGYFNAGLNEPGPHTIFKKVATFNLRELSNDYTSIKEI